MAARGAEPAHEGVAVGSTLQRQRREIKPGRPSASPLDQAIEVLGRQAQREAPVQEGARLLAGEPQIVGAQLEQLTVGAQRSDRQIRLRPAREHELEPGRRMVDEPPDAGAGWDARQPVEVIQDERDLTLAVQLVDQARQDHINDRRDDRIRRRRPGDGGAGTAQRVDRVRPRTTGSLSPSSSVSHATGFRAASASCADAASRVVFPKPAGQAMRVSLRSDPLRRPSSRRSRGIVSSRTGGGCSFVPTRIGCPAPVAPRRPRQSLAVQRCPGGGGPGVPDGATDSVPARRRMPPAQGT